ncbi:hypothetical protein [endosymbiont of Ridgeia piscesae]|jgi:hypothetical protein|uniref:Uncharacterized protein n=1 Tax=endosymbiont of Ridgeia piscesae TaxID=54398 RepID=A0A0T5Z698_9GAMM|nr:hypothetical protein [endosymbiont of Ridgeia piscesae]KRT58360.1 hypothetical protein Ga0076813_13382 [endosymbiont of Ridgeia piscesae]
MSVSFDMRRLHHGCGESLLPHAGGRGFVPFQTAQAGVKQIQAGSRRADKQASLAQQQAALVSGRDSR